jgi:hypothetical protein
MKITSGTVWGVGKRKSGDVVVKDGRDGALGVVPVPLPLPCLPCGAAAHGRITNKATTGKICENR